MDSRKAVSEAEESGEKLGGGGGIKELGIEREEEESCRGAVCVFTSSSGPSTVPGGLSLAPAGKAWIQNTTRWDSELG